MVVLSPPTSLGPWFKDFAQGCVFVVSRQECSKYLSEELRTLSKTVEVVVKAS